MDSERADSDDNLADDGDHGEELGTSVAEPGVQPLVRRVDIEGLFGRLDYTLDLRVEGGDPRLILLYGDNGAGKTTILKLLWHLLSSANNRGHRTAIRKTDFRRFTVELSDGTVVSAQKQRVRQPSVSISIEQSGRSVLRSEWDAENHPFDQFEAEFLRSEMHSFADDAKSFAQTALDRLELIDRLKELAITPYFLADDRRFYSDDLDRPDRGPRRLGGSEVEGGLDDGSSLVAQELVVALRRVSQLLQRLAVGGTATGSANANSVYLDVLQRLAGQLSQSGSVFDSTINLADELSAIGERNQHFHSLNLVPRFATNEFLESLERLDSTRAAIANEVLGPFLVSLRARLDALQPAAELIDTYLSEVNGFMVDKALTFDPRRGVRIRLQGGDDIRPDALSSGERQLVLLLSNAMLARRGTKLFIVDEPELSLNVKWQRNIVKSLLACTEGAPVQFLVATHSVEILAHYRTNIAVLDRASGD